MTPPGPRIAAYGFFGIGNLGNEASLQAFIDSVRQRHPDARTTCFALDPARVERQHGIPAVSLASRTFDGSGREPFLSLRKALSRLADVPRTFRLLRDVDAVVVPGTGSLETCLPTGTFGLPYWLFLVAVACRVRGRKFAMISVGAEEASSRLMRFFHVSAVRLAHYCSVRDDRSRLALRAMGVRRPLPVFPDLAFALPAPEEGLQCPELVVVGVMDYPGPRDSVDFGNGCRDRVAGSLADAVVALVDEGRSVCLVIGDDADRPVAVEVRDRALRTRPDLEPGRVRVSHATDLEGLMEEMARAAVVVTARFHNLVAALMLAKPTVSLGYARKHVSLLGEFGLEAFEQHLDEIDAGLLVRQVAEAEQGHHDRETAMKEALQRFADALAEQDAVFDELVLAGVRGGTDF